MSEDRIAAIFADLRAISGQISGLGPLHAGPSERPERIRRGHPHGFTADFADRDTLAACQARPDHKRVGAALVAHARGGLDGILVFDLSRGTPPG